VVHACAYLCMRVCVYVCVCACVWGVRGCKGHGSSSTPSGGCEVDAGSLDLLHMFA